jgi:hypothetical protein
MVNFPKLTVFQVSHSVPTVSNKPNHGPCQNFLQGVSQKFADKLTLKPFMVITTDFVGEVFH